MRILLAAAFLAVATPALAQFPPPGIYACNAADGSAIGELTLMVAGDYSFKDSGGAVAGGQVTSAGTAVTVISGPLGERGLLHGAFATDDTGKTVFHFEGPDGLLVVCQ